MSKILKVFPTEAYEAIQWDGTPETYTLLQECLIDVPGFGGLLKLKDTEDLMVLAPAVGLEENKGFEILPLNWWIILVGGKFIWIQSEDNFKFSFQKI